MTYLVVSLNLTTLSQDRLRLLFCWSPDISRGETYVVQFFLPTLIGNVIGILFLVAALGYAQVVGRKGAIEESLRWGKVTWLVEPAIPGG
jgi:hypothetical protein